MNPDIEPPDPETPPPEPPEPPEPEQPEPEQPEPEPRPPRPPVPVPGIPVIPPQVLPPWPQDPSIPPPSSDPVEPPVRPSPQPVPPDVPQPVQPDDPSIPPAPHHGNVKALDGTPLRDVPDDERVSETISIEKRMVRAYEEYYIVVRDDEGKSVEEYTIYSNPSDRSVAGALRQGWTVLFSQASTLLNGTNGNLFAVAMNFGGMITQPVQQTLSALLAGTQGYTWLGPYMSFGKPLNILDCVAAVHDADYIVNGQSNSPADAKFVSRCGMIRHGMLRAEYVDRDTGEEQTYEGAVSSHIEGVMVDTAEALIQAKLSATTLPFVKSFFGKTDPKDEEEKVVLYRRITELKHKIHDIEDSTREQQREFYERQYELSKTTFEKVMYKRIVLSLIRDDRRKTMLVHRILSNLQKQQEILIRKPNAPTIDRLVML